MRWRILVLLAVLAVAMLPGLALAQEANPESDLLLRVNGPANVGPAESIGTVVVISDDAVVQGTVRDTLIVVSGRAIVTGRVNGDLTVVDGSLDLRSGATVNNVTLIGSTLAQAPGATISGTLSQRSTAVFGWASTALTLFWWFGTTLVVLAGGLIFAGFGGRQLTSAASSLASRPGESILAGLICGIGVPVLAVAAMFTIVGIPLGIAALVVVLPAIWFLGYLVAGTVLGTLMARPFGYRGGGDHPFLAAMVGLFTLQIVALIPFFGWLVAFVAGAVGGGALIAAIWRGSRGPAPAAPVPAGTPAPTA